MSAVKYDCTFQVKYYQIDQELREKNKVTQEHNEEDIRDIVDDLYRYELTHAFCHSDFKEGAEDATISSLWHALKEYPPFMQVYALFREKCTFLVLEQEEEQEQEQEELLFVFLFSFDMFHAFHPCVCEYFTKREMAVDTLETLRHVIVSNQ